MSRTNHRRVEISVERREECRSEPSPDVTAGSTAASSVTVRTRYIRELERLAKHGDRRPLAGAAQDRDRHDHDRAATVVAVALDGQIRVRPTGEAQSTHRTSAVTNGAVSPHGRRIGGTAVLPVASAPAVCCEGLDAPGKV